MSGLPPDGDDAPSIPRFSLTTRGLPPKDGFEQWREAVAPVFDTAENRDSAETFAVTFDAFNFGPLVVANTRGDGIQHFERANRTVARSGIDHILVQAYVRGQTRLETDDETFGVGPGDIWLFDLGRTMRSLTHDFACVSVAIPRALLAPLVSDVDALHGVRLGARSPLGGLLFDYLRALAARAPEMTAIEAAAAADTTVHVVAGCVRPATEMAEPVAARIANALLARLRRGIDENLGDPDLGPDLLMRRHGLSRARLYRLFEPLGGVADYIRQRRLRRCLLDLAAPNRPELRIADVAHRWGFANEAAFSRAFRTQFGMTASEVRRIGVSDGGRDGAGESPLDRWMRDLMKR